MSLLLTELLVPAYKKLKNRLDLVISRWREGSEKSEQNSGGKVVSLHVERVNNLQISRKAERITRF